MALKLLTAEDANWDLERRAFNLVIDQQPAGIALPQSADDVTEVVRSAAADGKRVAAQRTGHLAAPLSSLAGTVLLHTAGLGGVQTIPMRAPRGSVPAPSGAIWSLMRPSWASAHCMARQRMSASPATRLVAASAFTLASTGSPATG